MEISAKSIGREIFNYNIYHPEDYLEVQIKPELVKNNLKAEKVWTFLVALKYHDNQSVLVNNLCSQKEALPNKPKIWLETYLSPTRIRNEERKFWKVRSDLCIGHLDLNRNRKSQLKSNGEWICIVEAKWFDDIHPNKKFGNIYQLSQIIEHAILMNDGNNFPERVYVNLVTPKYFKVQNGEFSERLYWKKYNEYKVDKKYLISDLRLCNLPFLTFDTTTLIKRIDALHINWITFEELLGFDNLVEDQIPGKYKVTANSWQQVFKKLGKEEVYNKLIA